MKLKIVTYRLNLYQVCEIMQEAKPSLLADIFSMALRLGQVPRIWKEVGLALI